MKNLLEQLKPEILKAVEKSSVKDELEILYYVSDIKYRTFIQLSEFYLSVFKQLPKDAWEIFN
jgi:hypothetical protein